MADVTVSSNVDSFMQAADYAAMRTLLNVENGATADQTGAEIKALYEAELDTNVYTDAEKSKLAGIEALADVTDTANVTAAGALMDSEVTNLAAVKAFDPTAYAAASHTHTLSDVTDSGTAAALDVAAAGDAATGEVVKGNDSRLTDARTPTSHTHTASEVTDFDAEVANNSAVAANTAKVTNATHTGDATGSGALTVVALRGVGLDSTVGTPSDGDILVYRSAGSDFVLEAKPAGGSNPAINDVTDITITTPADNEVLAYDNGTGEWINQTAAEAGLATLTGTETLTNKTLTTPKIGVIHDSNGNVAVNFPVTASAVNYIELWNSATGGDTFIGADGADANIDIDMFPKGTGKLYYKSSEIASTNNTLTLTNKTIRGTQNTISDLAASTITSGTLTHERGGLEADVSAYDGLVKISGGSTSAATAPTGTIVGTTDTQTLTNKTIAYGSNTLSGLPAFIAIACSDETTALTTGTAKATFRMPFAMTLTDIRASVTTAPTGATLIVDVNESGSTIMTTNKLSIDVSEKTSETAATAPGLTDTSLADDAEITIDIDQVGSTVAGAGLKVYLIGTRA